MNNINPILPIELQVNSCHSTVNSSKKNNDNTKKKEVIDQLRLDFGKFCKVELRETLFDNVFVSPKLGGTVASIKIPGFETTPALATEKIQNYLSGQNVKLEKNEIVSSRNQSILDSTEESLQLEGLQLFNVLEKSLIPQSEGSPFFHTDLCVFSDEYTGVLPNNGILEKDFKVLCNYVNKLRSGESAISIKEDADPLFKEAIISQIITLLTRPIGRQLFEKLESFKKPIFIQNSKTSHYNRRDKTISIHLNQEVSVKVFSKYGIKVGASPDFISLAHELVHALHDVDETYIEHSSSYFYKDTSKLLDPKFHNLEEQQTIIGVGEKQPFPLKVDENKLKEDQEELTYSPPISEALLRAEHGLPIRWGHKGSFAKTLPSKLSEEQLSNITTNAKETYRLVVAALNEGRYDIFKTICNRWNKDWDQFNSWFVPLAASSLNPKALALTLKGNIEERTLHQEKAKIETELKFLGDSSDSKSTISPQITQQKIQILLNMYQQLKNKAETLENPQKKFEINVYQWIFFSKEICKEWLHREIDSVEGLVNTREYLPNITLKILEIEEIPLIAQLTEAVENLPPKISWHNKVPFDWDRWIAHAKKQNLSEEVVNFLIEGKKRSAGAS